MAEIGVGSTVWVFDGNRRVYGPDNGMPIYREYWAPVVIVGENRASWLIGNWYRSFSKKPPHQTKTNAYGSHRVAISAQEVDDDCWIFDHRHSVIRRVEALRDIATLRQIAALVGYIPAPSREERKSAVSAQPVGYALDNPLRL